MNRKPLPFSLSLLGFALSGAAAFAAPAERQAFFGDLHLHTSNSFDAYVLMGTKTTPEDAYRFARGETIEYLGQKVRRSTVLDFMAITDHSENLGVFNELGDPQSALSQSELGQRIRKGQADGTLSLSAKRSSGETGAAQQSDASKFLRELLDPKSIASAGVDARTLSSAAWRRSIATANKYYSPGTFTTFIGYEWTSMPNGQNLHRNVIFRGDDAPSPFSSADSHRPEDLWTYLATIRGKGFEALAIPHNQNASGGLMYDWATVDGKPIDVAYSVLRAANEPVSEISQNKGTSETHPALSPNDEFANFEIFDRLLLASTPSRPEGSYVRDALGRGLLLAQKLGVNPYKDGFVAAGDLHGGLEVFSEADFGGNIGGANVGGGRTSRENAEIYLADPSPGSGLTPVITGSASMTGVWAEENTRESIYDAIRRKETFATSGTKIKVRLFGGWNLPAGIDTAKDGVKRAYSAGVPQGGDLPARPTDARSPSFVVWSSKDPDGANLDRVQVVKVWVEGGKQLERIYDVAFEKGRAQGADGKLAAVGNTVDLKTGKFKNSIGSTALSTVWTDPAFDASQPAAYYVRVLEIPTARWSTLLALQHGLPLPKSVPPTIQERAWSSPIWYSPSST